MTRINGKGPKTESDTTPRQLPYVLLCRKSGAMCGNVWTVNYLTEWRDTIRERRQHENRCKIPARLNLMYPGDAEWRKR